MNEALAAFVGAFVGSLLTVLFAGRTARAQALGQQWAERRCDIIERLAVVLYEAEELTENAEGIPTHEKLRGPVDVHADFVDLLARGQLYLSDEAVCALRPFANWLFNSVQPDTVDPSWGAPDMEAGKKARKLLAEAIEGKHGRD